MKTRKHKLMNGDNQAFKLFGFTDGAVTWGMLVVL